MGLGAEDVEVASRPLHVDTPLVSIVMPVFGLINRIFRILKGRRL